MVIKRTCVGRRQVGGSSVQQRPRDPPPPPPPPQEGRTSTSNGAALPPAAAPYHSCRQLDSTGWPRFVFLRRPLGLPPLPSPRGPPLRMAHGNSGPFEQGQATWARFERRQGNSPDRILRHGGPSQVAQLRVLGPSRIRGSGTGVRT